MGATMNNARKAAVALASKLTRRDGGANGYTLFQWLVLRQLYLKRATGGADDGASKYATNGGRRGRD